MTGGDFHRKINTMTPNTPDGGPAFPDIVLRATLRDWFAGQALAGIATRGSVLPYNEDAEMAYRWADAMLAEREKGKR